MALGVMRPSPFPERMSWGGGLISGALAIHLAVWQVRFSTVPLRGFTERRGCGELGGHAVGS
jgi:hypothetical protein